MEKFLKIRSANLTGVFLFILFSTVLLSSSCKEKEIAPKSEMDIFIDDLMSQMTVEEKIGQLNMEQAGHIVTGQAQSSDVAGKIKEGKIGALLNTTSVEKLIEIQKIAVEGSRLKIPLLFGLDVIHGYETIFPIPLAMSCSWDTALIENMARIAAVEASADGLCWTFSPMIDLSRDPRWGRVAEGSGEDPFLVSQIARAMVHGYQGDDLKANNTIMSCVKHFALYGAPEAGRDYNTVDMSRLRMYNVYFPPYKAAVEAGAGSVMTSFNDVDGIPASANKWLLTDVLRNQWGFDGLVFTDYTTINEMTEQGLGDLLTVSARALKAGVDMDMIGQGYLTTLKKSFDEGKVTEADIDRACRLILETKYKLGLFEDPYKYLDVEKPEKHIFTEEHLEAAQYAASQSFVLLKNEEQTLPLKKGGSIALIGPLADNKENMLGTWSVSGDPAKAISLYEGIKSLVGDEVKINLARGANFVSDPALESRVSVFGKPTYRDDRSEDEMIREAVEVARKSDVVVAAVGEPSEMSGECSSVTSIQLPETQRNLLKALVKTGKPVIVVLFSGRPLAIKWESENVPAILQVWFGGTQAGHAMAQVLFGDVNPSGKLSMTFPQNVGQIPIYYNYKKTGRPLPEGEWFLKFTSSYIDVSNDPVYPFGYGLSYTKFNYSNLKVSKQELSGDDNLMVTVDVENIGDYAGKEVVQLYIRDVVGTITRPLKELKGFKKIHLDAGETKTVAFSITTDDLRFYNYDLNFEWEPGEFEIMVGTNSNDVERMSIIWN